MNCRSVFADSITIADSGRVALISHAASNPFKTGIVTFKTMKRAENAAAALRAAGLADSIPVETSGRGAKDLAVPTPPNTREPLNDRALVEIESPSK